MNKFTKYYVGGAAALIGLVCLLHPKQVKSNVSYVKKYFIVSIQLINRLIEQLKTSRIALHTFTHSIKSVNVKDITQDINQSTGKLQNQVNQLQKVLKQTKNN